VVIPVEINNVKLSFILDTGVTSTLLFGATKDTLELKNTTVVKLLGLGKGDAVEALKSDYNTLKVGNAVDNNHSLYTVFDENLNFSNRMGVPIHGILGYEFFKNFVVAINYNSKVIKYTQPKEFKEKKKRGYTTYPLLLEKGRPFINNISINGGEDSLMLLDIGSSDSVWVFDDLNITSEIEKNYFEDFLGLGLSGSIYGRRSRVNDVAIGSFNFKEVNVAIPESSALVKSRMIQGRKGSVGAQLMKRFNIIINYSENEISLKKNRYYNNDFYYNMSGLTLEHNGMLIVKNRMAKRGSITRNSQNSDSESISYAITPTYSISLVPSVVVAEVRENSSGEKAGIRVGDEILNVNGKPAYKYKLHEITALFSSKDGKSIMLLIDRNGQRLKKKFRLKKLF